MSKQKKFNSTLLLIATITSILAVYFGIKNQNLSKELSKQKTDREELKIYNSNVARIDSLIFTGSYQEALEVSNTLKQSDQFKNDSLIEIRYQLASEMVKVEKNKKNLALAPKRSFRMNRAKVVGINKLDVNADSLSKNIDSQLTSTSLPIETSESPSNEYLVFNTTKGTSLHYIGDIKNDKANGHGVAILESGSRYEGQWENNKRNGLGKFFWDDGDYYEGSYKNDKRSGLGTYHWKNGEKYVGHWENDKRNGQGQFFNKKGKLKTSGIWKDDELVKKDKKH